MHVHTDWDDINNNRHCTNSNDGIQIILTGNKLTSASNNID